MRTLFILLIVIAAGVFVFRNHDWFSPEDASHAEANSKRGAKGKNAAVAELKPTPTPIPTPAEPESLNEDAYITLGMPPLSNAWDAPTLKNVAAALHSISQKRARAMPGPDTEYGRAFFAKLRSTVARFHLLSSENKVASYNAFRSVVAEFGGAFSTRPRDREMALLTGLQCELMVGVIEDPEFVNDTKEIKTRTLTDMSGKTYVFTPSYVRFQASAGTMAQDLEERLKLIGDAAHFRPEARALALSYLSLHLPTIAQRLDMKNIRPILVQNRNSEADAGLRAQYDTLIMRVP